MTGKPAQATLRCQRIQTLQKDHMKIDFGQTGTTNIKKRSTVVRETMWLVKWKDRPHWCESQFGHDSKTNGYKQM